MSKRIVVNNNIIFDQVASLIAQGESVTILTKGNSMLPFIIGGHDSIVLVPTVALSIGDIILAKVDNERYVVHRIIEIDGEKITMMGDGNIKGREQIRRTDVVASVEAIIHNGKSVDCNNKKERRRAKIWRHLLFIRRYILAIYKRLPHIKALIN